ncbi:MAG: tetratricopeptide repeat protein [Deltaproteobacteria bacterium]|nr:MAG: tetratricopeptide repeat protein [Deltaproteobacteria bacterium]
MRTTLRRPFLIVASLALVAALPGCDKNRVESIKLVNSGIQAANAGSADSAYGYFTRAARIDPENHRAYYEAALIDLYDKGRQEEGLARLETAEKLAPHDRDVLFQLGRTHVVNGDAEAGVRYLTRALSEDKNYAGAYYFKGVALRQLGRYDEADKAFREALACDPTYVPAFRDLGMMYEQFDAFDAARAVYLEGLKYNEEDPDLLNNLGLLAMQEGNVKEGITYFDRAVGRSSSSLTVFNLAFAYVADGNVRQAYRRLGEYINAADPTAGEQIKVAHMLRSAMLEELRRQKEEKLEQELRGQDDVKAPTEGKTDDVAP